MSDKVQCGVYWEHSPYRGRLEVRILSPYGIRGSRLTGGTIMEKRMKANMGEEFNLSPWQIERGERHGNNRRWIANAKKVARRNKRAAEKAKVGKEIRETYD